MNYLMLAAFLTLTGLPKTSDTVVEWCKETSPIGVKEIVDGKTVVIPSYLRRIVVDNIKLINGKRGKENIELVYEDRGAPGRDRADVLRIEGNSFLYFDEGGDGKLDGGQVQGIFFYQGIPKGHQDREQRKYTALLGELEQRIKERSLSRSGEERFEESSSGPNPQLEPNHPAESVKLEEEVNIEHAD